MRVSYFAFKNSLHPCKDGADSGVKSRKTENGLKKSQNYSLILLVLPIFARQWPQCLLAEAKILPSKLHRKYVDSILLIKIIL